MLDHVREALPEPLKRALRRLRLELLSVGLPKSANFIQSEAEVQASKSISIVVAINDAPQVLQRCLASLEKYASRAEVILVDDGSALEATERVIRHFGVRNGWNIIRHESSRGHSRSCEAGASAARRPVLCLLNSDAVVTPWSWEGIMKAFESDPNVAVVGPSTSWAITIQAQTRAKHCRHFWTDSQIDAYARQVVTRGQNRPLVDLAEASGCAFFIRRNLWEALGGFDLNLPDYGNESELCIRLRQRGYRIVWTQGSYVHHFGRQSYGQAHEEKWQAGWRYIAQKHNRP